MTTAIHTRADHLATARRYAANRQDWPVAPRFDPHRRWYHRLATEPDSEVWVLTWWPGQGTEIHDHGGSAGAFLVVAGALTERTFTADPAGGPLRFDDRLHGAGQGRSFGRQHVHQVANSGAEPAISVHVYSPVLREMTRYGIASGHLVVTAVDRAGGDW